MRRTDDTGPLGRPRRMPVVVPAATLPLLAVLALGACASLEQAWTGRQAEETAVTGSAHERGKAHLAAGRHALAIRDFRSALEREPDSVAALNGLAAAYDRVARHDLAARYYARALALEPGSAQTLNNLGYSYLLQHRYDMAVAYLRAAHAGARDDPVIAGNRRIAESALTEADLARSKRIAEQTLDPPPATQWPSWRRPWIARTAPGVRTLITGHRAAWAGIGGDATVDPRLAAHRLPESAALDVSGPLAAPLADRPSRDTDRDGLPGFLAAPLAARDGGRGKGPGR